MDETTSDRDSLGNLDSSRRSSGNSQRQKPQSEPTSAAVLNAIARIARLRGEPWGRDEGAAEGFARDWQLVLGDIPWSALDKAVTEFLKRPGSKWAQPGDLRELAKKFMPETPTPDRYQFRQEHHDYSTLSDTARRYDRTDKLKAMGCSPSYIEWHVRDRAQTVEAHEKVKAMSPATLRRLGLDDYSLHLARTIMGGARRPTIKIEGASPQFLDLIGQSDAPNHPVTESPPSEGLVIGSQSPPEGLEDFDGCSDGQF